MDTYDVIVVGAGHAGTEAALATARLGCKTLLCTLSKHTLGAMSCNPAIGGVGKGQLVKEIDALGGIMARAADACGIQFRLLNDSKGEAVQSSRAQIDRLKYKKYITNALEAQKNLSIKEAEACGILVEDGVCQGVKTKTKKVFSKVVVISPGTFLNGVIHMGLKNFPGGRINESSSRELSESLRNLGLNILRFKTGTCPRLDGRTIDFSKLRLQKGDSVPRPFSFATKQIKVDQINCYITYTNPKTHEVIRANLNRSPLYTGIIKSTGVRYCPSIEDKIVKFPGRERHQIFLEPECLDTYEYYPNGVSTSLPEDVQYQFLHSITGLQKVKVLRFGYGIEHDVVEPRQLFPTLETKEIKNLYLAGQINGTTGYEEAASQGLIAGINAGLNVFKRSPLILDRSTSYIGVLIDDLVTKGTLEPYRMFTSRVEYRLILREDNADLRLTKIGYDVGLVTKKDYKKALKKEKEFEQGIKYLGSDQLKLLKRPEVKIEDLKKVKDLKISNQALKQIEISTKYEGFIKRQISEVERFRNLEKIRLPQGIDYSKVTALSCEIREKLTQAKPLNLGQASRISGVTPVAISLLMIWLKKNKP